MIPATQAGPSTPSAPRRRPDRPRSNQAGSRRPRNDAPSRFQANPFKRYTPARRRGALEPKGKSEPLFGGESLTADGRDPHLSDLDRPVSGLDLLPAQGR
jgi:hypothetical protein